MILRNTANSRLKSVTFLLQVHKILLAATSDYFRTMLKGSMKESQEHFVDLKSLTSETLEEMIEFMYTGEITFSFDDNLVRMIDAASLLQVFISKGLSIWRDYNEVHTFFST